jgi:hypothetical protein
MRSCPDCDPSRGRGSASRDKPSLTSRDAFEQKRVPVWVFLVITGLFLFALLLIFIR